MRSIGRERNGYTRWWWYSINDNRRLISRGVEEYTGSILRHGRWYLYYFGTTLLKLSWSFFGGRVLGGLRDWLTADVMVSFNDDEDRGVTLHLSLSRLFSVWVTVALPRRWLSPWMIHDRVFGVRLGYIGDIAWVLIAHAAWAEDCGMTGFYRRQKPRKYTDAQLWPGWEIKIRWPRVLDWIFGRSKHEVRIVAETPVRFQMDGREVEATVRVEARENRRPRWPWAYRKSIGSWIEVPKPPQFAGKGENSWDCGDDGIYGMGSRETSPAAVVGDYIKAVLESRERYGMPSELR